MNYILLLLLSAQAFSAVDFLELDAKSETDFVLNESKWLVDLGVKHIRYDAFYPAFTGKNIKISNEDTLTTYSTALNIGRQFYLGAGISFTLKVGGFYADNKRVDAHKASPEVDFRVNELADDYIFYGQEAAISLNYAFENSLVHVQPFFEFALGRMNAKLSKSYFDRGIDSGDTDIDYPAEEYSYEVEEAMNYARLALGVNFISNYNVNSYLKVSQNTMQLDSREVKRQSASSAISSAERDDDIFSLLSASAGVTYTF